MRRDFTAVTALVALVAVCAQCESKPQGQPPAAVAHAQTAADSLTAPVPAGGTGAHASFDPEGYYFPAETLVVRGYQLDHMALDAAGGSLHFGPGPGHRDGPSVLCGATAVTADALQLSCVEKRVGHITVAGAFLDKRGSFWKWPEIKPQETVVLQATLSFEGQGGLESRLVHFTYWQGD